MQFLIILIVTIVACASAFISRQILRAQIRDMVEYQCDGLDSHEVAKSDRGLLSGISDISKAKFYSNNIAIKDSYELLKDTKHIYNICLNNADGNST
jgi:hypothetical protein